MRGINLAASNFIRDSEDADPLSLKLGVARAIFPGTKRVRWRVQFDREAGLFAMKVDDGSSDHLLTAKMEAIDLIAPQAAPQPGLGWRHPAAQRPGDAELFG